MDLLYDKFLHNSTQTYNLWIGTYDFKRCLKKDEDKNSVSIMQLFSYKNNFVSPI